MDGGGLVYKKPGNFVNLCFCYFDTTLEMKWRTRVAFVSFVALLLLFLVFSILYLFILLLLFMSLGEEEEDRTWT